MLRHAEMIRLSIMLLERAGYDVNAAGGPAYCCGTAHDHQPQRRATWQRARSARFNEAAEKEERRTVVTWCPSCHMHMSDIMAPGNATAFDVAHVTELLADSADRLAPLLTRPGEAAGPAAPALGVRHARAGERSASPRCWRAIPGLELVEGPAVPGHMCSSLAAVPGALATASRRRGPRPVAAAPTRSAPSSIPATASLRRSRARMACGEELGPARRRGHGHGRQRRLSRLAQRWCPRHRRHRAGRCQQVSYAHRAGAPAPAPDTRGNARVIAAAVKTAAASTTLADLLWAAGG